MFKKLRSTIEGVKAAYRLFIDTVQTNTIQLQALAQEQRVLREKLDSLVTDSNYLVTAKKRELQRAGHAH